MTSGLLGLVAYAQPTFARVSLLIFRLSIGKTDAGSAGLFALTRMGGTKGFSITCLSECAARRIKSFSSDIGHSLPISFASIFARAIHTADGG